MQGVVDTAVGGPAPAVAPGEVHHPLDRPGEVHHLLNLSEDCSPPYCTGYSGLMSVSSGAATFFSVP